MKKIRLSIMIPVYNEKETILKIIKRIENVKIKSIEKEIIIVDDFSIDGTRDIIKKLKEKNIKKVFHKKNYGKGMAIRTAIKNSTGDILIIQDADLEYHPEDYKKLLKPILSKKTDVVYGSRMFSLTKKEMHTSHYFGNIFLSFLTRVLYRTKITDMETCYKIFRKEVVKDMKLDAKRFEIEPEITAKILKRGYKIIEIPIKFNARTYAEGKKITWKDGINALYCLFKYRFWILEKKLLKTYKEDICFN